MRLVPIASAALTLALVASGASVTAVASNRQSHFSQAAQSLQKEWDIDVAEGLPASSIKPLRAALQTSTDDRSTWWSPHWWGDTGMPLIDSLKAKTKVAWNAAMGAARSEAQTAVVQWQLLNQQLGSFIPADQASAAGRWPAQIRAASTPLQLQRLTRTWLTQVGTMRTRAQTAQLNSEVSGYGGVAGLLSDAQKAVSIAQADNLDTVGLPDLINTVQSQFAGGVDASDAIRQLVNATAAEQNLISINNNIAGLFRPIELSADQAGAEGTPNSSGFLSQYANLQGSFRDSSTTDQLTALQSQLTALKASIDAELAANVCGHNTGAGKVIDLNLSLQEAVFYQDGCVAGATPITTGRPQLRTPTGHFSIFYKQSPFQFISPWPPDSPFYYYPSWTSWVMEFAGGGYFIHDAPWEPSWEYGPGGENSGGASHGCVHIPTSTMQWLYSWTPYGTPVNVHY